MINADVRIRVEEFWAKELCCSRDALHTPGSHVFIRDNNNGAFVFRYGECCIWHVPKRFAPAVEQSVKGRDGVDYDFNGPFIGALFGPSSRLILGPCPIAYLGHEMPAPNGLLPPSRKLTKDDHAAVSELAANCGAEAWDHGGVELEAHPAVFGCFLENQLVSAASYEIWGDAIAHIGVATAPGHRGRGFAKSTATAATAHALHEGLVPQWRTLASNIASVRVGRAIGFEELATHFFVRLAVE